VSTKTQRKSRSAASRRAPKRGRTAAAESPDVSVIIPIYNEEALLRAAVIELVDALDAFGWTYEILLTENGSTDHTVEIALGLEREIPVVRVLRTSEPNYGLALRRGIKAALGQYVLCDEIDICDTGFHERAMAILESDQCDMVIGSKLHEEALDKRPMMRHAATIGINMLLRIFLDFKGTDTHGLKAFHRERLLSIVDECIVDKDLFASELVIRAERRQLRILEIPVEIMEKRKPSIDLFRRVPNVLKNLARLVVAIRFGKEI
jgi:glycosyltransferase involved in cell wall biosynthesis